MIKNRICEVPDCDNPRVKGARICQDHLGDRVRCSKMILVDPDKPELGKRQCKNSARKGTALCKSHSGPKTEAVAHRAAAMTAMQRFVKPFDGNLDPITAFELEFRRTYGRILWLEEQIAELNTEDLTWGKTKSETIYASEFSGTNTTYEARIHVYEEMLRWERKHFLDLEKLWIQAKLDAKKLTIMREAITYTYGKVIEAAKALGHDPNDETTRRALLTLFYSEGDDTHAELPGPQSAQNAAQNAAQSPS